MPWDRILDGSAVASAYYLKTGLVRKAELYFWLGKRAPQLLQSALPESLIGEIEEDDIESDIGAFLQALRAACDAAAPSMWVLKPSEGNRGEGIAVLRQGDVAGARQTILRHPAHRRWLMQRYVTPLLLPPTPGQAEAAGRRPCPCVHASHAPAALTALRDAAAQAVGGGSHGPAEQPGHKFHLRVHLLAAAGVVRSERSALGG